MRPSVLITDNEITEELLVKDKIWEKSKDYNFMKVWLGNGLFTASRKTLFFKRNFVQVVFYLVGSRWKTRRRLLAPWFGKVTTLKSFVKIFEEQSNVFIDNLEKHLKGSSHIDVLPLSKEFALDVVCGKINKFRLILTVPFSTL